MPGHKRRVNGDMPQEIMGIDITEIDGFDNLQDPTGILKEIQERASRVFHAQQSYLLVNGSTCGILSAISAALPKKGHILMARNCHKAAYHGAYLRQLRITYLYPQKVADFDICEAITPTQVKEALENQKDIDAVFIVSPTYEGRIADVAQIAELVHQRGIPLIVDEAHGAHLGFGAEFAQNSNQAGADVVIQSVHKTLPALTQTAILHLNSNRIDPKRLERFLHIYQTSSPSYVLMASIDNAITFLEKESNNAFPCFYKNYQNMIGRLSSCKNIRILTESKGRQDIGKLVLDCGKTNFTGRQLYDKLRNQYHLQLEMACESYCLAMFTVADDEIAYQRMIEAILRIDEEMEQNNPPSHEHRTEDNIENVIAYEYAKAWDMPEEAILFSRSIGRIAADFVNVYPPGIPILVPGEIVSQKVYDKITLLQQEGLNIQGLNFLENQYYINCLREKTSSINIVDEKRN